MRSNITLRSNVYINKTNRRNDPDFVRQLRDYNSLCRYYDPVYRTAEVPLTEVQYAILQQGSPKCALESGTMSWGVPIGTERFVCRCEKTDCHRYSICSHAENFEEIIRGTEVCQLEEDKPVIEPEDEEFINVPTDIYALEEDDAQEPEEPPVETVATESFIKRKTQDISYLTQESVINADINSRIAVNAGPGSGKTYVVIQRLRTLLENGDSDKSILVLCFSKNAVNVIRERLRAEIGSTIDSLIADGRLIIRTFDSFAAYMLADELPKGLTYTQNIDLFIRKVSDQPEVLDGVEYLIVDEMQDTVGVRARMLQCMTEHSDFGVLLLGDRCQAIYDWSIRGSGDWTSDALFDWAGRKGFQLGELRGNHRQIQELGEIGETMRHSLLYGDANEQEQALAHCKKKIEKQWPGCKMQDLPQKLSRQSELILCKTNGEAAVVSDLLYGSVELIEHTVMQNAGHKSLAPWIGMILGGCTDLLVSKEEFAARAMEHGIGDIDAKWDALMSLDPHIRSAVLHRREVLARLASMDALPAECLNRPGDGVVVSTVHRAKGSEANHVYWLDSPLVFDNQEDEVDAKSDALKASYVAVTRAKRDIRLITPDKVAMRSLSNDRWIKLGWSGRSIPFCSGIALQPDDVDLLSCASGANVQQMQEKIGSLEFGREDGRDVTLYPSSDGSYFDIFFDGYQIGRTSAAFTSALLEGFRVTNKNKNMPANITYAYISALVTVVDPSGANGENEYQSSGCWLGYELGGFAHINYT